jgi:transcriptional regulator with XRE-family HTH domain
MNQNDIEILKKQFGKKVLELRTDKDLSLRELAGQCGLDNSKISKIEKGKINVSLSTLVELARGLEVHPAELLKGGYEWISEPIANQTK